MRILLFYKKCKLWETEDLKKTDKPHKIETESKAKQKG